MCVGGIRGWPCDRSRVENYPVQRQRVYAQKDSDKLDKNNTIAFSLNALSSWDYARRAGFGVNGEWASEWVLVNKDKTYVKTTYDADHDGADYLEPVLEINGGSK